MSQDEHSSIDFSSKAVRRGMTGGSGLLSLKTSEEVRVNTLAEQQKRIQKMYKELAEKAKKAAEQLKDKTNISSILRQSYLNNLANQLIAASNSLGQELEQQIRNAIQDTAQGVVEDQRKFLLSVEAPYASSAFSYIPREIVEAVANGNIYAGDWTLSKAIWGMSEKTADDINRIIAEGIAQNKGSYAIAKDLELYVNPSAKKPWDWSKVYPGTNKVIDYNAQRLARTLVSHAYQQALVNTCAKNPFVTGFKWRSAHIVGRTCALCNERDGKIYPKDELPLDHPNGLCTYLVIIPDTSDQIVDRLANWVKGGKDPALDEYALDFMTRQNYSAFMEKRAV